MLFTKKYLLFLSLTLKLKLNPITEILFHFKIWQPNAVHHCCLDHHGNKSGSIQFDGCTSSSDSGGFFRRWDSKDGVRGKKEEDERAKTGTWWWRAQKIMNLQLWWTLFPWRCHFFSLKSVRRTWYHASWFWALTLVLDSENLSCHSTSFSSCGVFSLCLVICSFCFGSYGELVWVMEIALSSLFVCLSFSSVCASCSRPYQCCCLCLCLSPLVALLFYSDGLFSLDFLFGWLASLFSPVCCSSYPESVCSPLLFCCWYFWF